MNIFDMMFGEEPAAGQAITLLTKTVTDFQEASGCFGCIRKLQGALGAVNFDSIAWGFCGILLQVFKAYIDGHVKHDELKDKMVPGPKLCK